MESDFDRKAAELIARGYRFDARVYRFVAEAVTYTVSRCDTHRHVSAQELLTGVRQMAVERFGKMAGRVMEKWGLKLDDDVGEVVYLLIGVGLLGESDEDSPDDFKSGNPLFPELPSPRRGHRKSVKLPFID